MPLWFLLSGLLLAGSSKAPTRVTVKAGLNQPVNVTAASLGLLPTLQITNPQLLQGAPKPQLLLMPPRQAETGSEAKTNDKPLLIETLSVEQADFSELPSADVSGAAEKDFMARAQLGETATGKGATLVTGDLVERKSGLKKFALFTKNRKKPVEAVGPSSGIPEALERVDKGERKVMLRGPPRVSDLKLIAQLPRMEVLLTRHRETGQWTLWAGDLHNVDAEGDEAQYDRFYHNHPMIRMGGSAINTVHPSPQDLVKAEGLDGRFMVISEYGIVEWNSDTGRAYERFGQSWRDRLVMRITFPSGYPGLLSRKSVAFVDKAWSKVTQDWLDQGVPPENEATLARREAAERTAQERSAAAQEEAPVALHQGELFQSSKILNAEKAVAGLAEAGRNWYYNVVKDDPEAVGVLKKRLSPANLPLAALENRLKADAALLGVELGKVVSVYRYGSSLWGHKTAKPGDVDVLVVVEGEAKGAGVQTREAVSVVSETNPRSFLMYMNEEVSPIPGALPLNVTVVSREYIADYQANGGQPEEAEKLDMGELFGDWGHGVLVYGEDALSAIAPKPQHLILGAAKTERNAGGFMENYIYKIDGRKAQPLSGGAVSRTSEEENNKLVPKIYLRYIEMSLRLKTALELQGKDAATIKKLIGDPGERYRAWITGRAHSELPVVTQKLTAEMIGIHNQSSGQIQAVRKADWTPEMHRKERLESILRMVLMIVGIAGAAALLYLLS
jgi:hypothetical protein